MSFQSGLQSFSVLLPIAASLPHDAAFFANDIGHMGMPCSPIEKGDEPCVLAGCKLPVVLRRANDKHTFVCPTYVDDVTHIESCEDRSSKAHRGATQIDNEE
jgi:hypothetical protein